MLLIGKNWALGDRMVVQGWVTVSLKKWCLG